MTRYVCVMALLLTVACGDDDDDDDDMMPDSGGQGADSATAIDAAAAGPDAAAIDPDPLPGEDDPGEYGGTDCPDSDETVFTLALTDVSSNVFSGTVTDADDNGYYYVRGDASQEVFGSFGIDPTTGAYSVEIPMFCGAQVVKLRWTNATCDTVIVYEVTNSGCTTPDLRITLAWDDIGDDWELHLIKPGGRINDDLTDCTWTSCIGASPDWGVMGDASDDPSKDVDNTEAFGPENIVLSGLENGVYTVMVEHWGSTGSPMSDGAVIINVAGEPIVLVEMNDLPYQSVWTAATIEFPGNTVTPSADVFDCSANWASGCQEDIP